MGGSERHLLLLLPALRAAGVDVRMLVPVAGEASRFVDPMRELGVPVETVPAGPDLNPLVVAALARRIHAFRPDLLHTHLVHADIHGQLAAALARVSRVSSVHGTPSFYRREPYRSTARIAGRFASQTIAISQHVRRFLEELRLRRPGTIEVVPYGLDAAEWPLPDQQRAEARSVLGLAQEDVAVGIAARLIPGKGHDHLLEAYAKAAPGAPRLRLLVAGDGPLRERLAREAARHGDGRVKLLGYLSDMRAFMNACDVLAFPTEPSLGEGFGLAALEAMASGRPVVATAVGSLPEVVEHGVTGLLVRPGAVDELAASLSKLAGDRSIREAMGSRAQDRARTVFSVEAMVERTLAVYRRALPG